MSCITHLRGRFAQGVAGAAGLLDGDGELIGSEVDLTTDCTFFGGVLAESIGIQWSIGGLAIILTLATIIIYIFAPQLRKLD